MGVPTRALSPFACMLYCLFIFNWLCSFICCGFLKEFLLCYIHRTYIIVTLHTLHEYRIILPIIILDYFGFVLGIRPHEVLTLLCSNSMLQCNNNYNDQQKKTVSLWCYWFMHTFGPREYFCFESHQSEISVWNCFNIAEIVLNVRNVLKHILQGHGGAK